GTKCGRDRTGRGRDLGKSGNAVSAFLGARWAWFQASAELAVALLFDTGGQAYHFVENAMGDLGFAELRKREVATIAGEDGDDIGVYVEAGAFGGHVVSDNEVGMFVFEFLPGVFRDAVGFSGKTNDQAIAFFAGHGGENVGVRDELQRDALICGTLDFACSWIGWAIVSYRSREDGDVGAREVLFNNGQHLGRGAHVDARHVRGSFKRGGAADQNDSCATLCGRFCHAVTHAAGRAVGEDANGVDAFLGGAGGKQNGLAREVAANA